MTVHISAKGWVVTFEGEEHLFNSADEASKFIQNILSKRG